MISILFDVNVPRGDEMSVIHVFEATDVGMKRDQNEDAIRYIHRVSQGHFCNIEYRVLILADGMGGYRKGEVASNRACDSLARFSEEKLEDVLCSKANKKKKRELFQYLLRKAIDQVNVELFHEGEEEGALGCTLVYVLQFKNNLFIAHIGDSRAYLILGDTMERLTKDHSYVNALVENRVITEEEALTHPMRNVITRSIGTKEKVEAEFNHRFFLDGSTVLVCSDGLTDLVSDEKILDIVRKNSAPRVCEALVNEANRQGGKDNISVLLLVSTPDTRGKRRVKKLVVRRGG